MNITRNTLRADGLTVGQAIDKDAAFLRSIGFAVSDGGLTFDEQRDEMREKCRKAVLDALDYVADETLGSRNYGPKDAELARLFAGIDPIADRMLDKTLGL